jgi:hypothetical protein
MIVAVIPNAPQVIDFYSSTFTQVSDDEGVAFYVPE